MQAKQYDFNVQHEIGKKGEQILDRWLGTTYKITDVSHDPKYQGVGIDRILTRPDSSVITVEYKFDLAAKRTGNLFFETVSIDCKSIPGWGWSSQADYWIFLIPDQEILIIKPPSLRALIWRKYRENSEKQIPNRGYNTLGLPIPLSEVRKIATQVQKLYLDNL
ncbi:hypothetical protein [Pseudanabaena sp. PCC 6802]|uniref:hypothetical protein n=1 Tax=Pseudanabaena sp. PCC 6802 TaxID=118173 RepID=UPI00034B23CD|nr:hypothetical protein [Pseudanabaena sp. PCC 6802]